MGLLGKESLTERRGQRCLKESLTKRKGRSKSKDNKQILDHNADLHQDAHGQDDHP
jgi:hypothetical protein